MRARRGLAMAVASVVLLSGCVVESPKPKTSPSAAPTDDATRARLVEVLLAQREKAVRSGDEGMWLSGVAGGGELVEAERMRFGNLRQLQWETFDLQFDGFTFSDRGPTPEPHTASAGVTLVMRLVGDLRPSAAQYSYHLVFTGARAAISGIKVPSDDTDPPAGGNPVGKVNLPWDTVRLRSAKAGPVTVLADATSPWKPQDYIDAARRAQAFVRSAWGRRRAPTGFVIFLASDAQFGTWFGKNTLPASTLGYVTYPPMVNPDGQPTLPGYTRDSKTRKFLYTDSTAGARIVLRAARTPGRAAYPLMVHEIAHAMGPHILRVAMADASSEGRMNQPSWVVEGFATYLENLARPGGTAAAMAQVRRYWTRYRPASGVIPANKNFYATDSQHINFNYNLASAFFHAAEKVGGRDAATRAYHSLAYEILLSTDQSMFLNPTLREIGINPDRFWAAHKRLIQ